MAWQFDHPTGTYRNHTLSNNVRHTAIADAKFFKFLKSEPFGRRKGDSKTIMRVGNLGLATRVAETDQLPNARPAISTKTISVSHWGSKMQITEAERAMAPMDLVDEFKSALRKQMTLTLDKMAADAFKQTLVKYVPTTAGATITVDGTPGTTANRNLGIQDLRRIHDYLKSGNSGAAAPVSPFRNGQYVGILSVQAARGIMNDSEYKDWLAPTSSAPFKDGMLRNVEGFDLYVSNHVNALEDNVGASTTTGEAVFFGEGAAGLLEVIPPEIRMSIPDPNDLGRSSWLGWVGTLEAFLEWELAADFRVVHVSST